MTKIVEAAGVGRVRPLAPAADAAHTIAFQRFATA